MNRLTRLAAVALLALMLPVQGFAAACAQICAQVKQSEHAAMMTAMAAGGEQAPDGEHCSDIGKGKCCQAHTFMVDTPIVQLADALHGNKTHAFVARWTNFIPEAPSPPPIASAAFA